MTGNFSGLRSKTAANTSSSRASTPLKSLLACGVMAFAFTLAPTSDAQAKQCVWNKGGYVLKASWYESEDVSHSVDANGRYTIVIADDGKPLQEDEFPVAQGRCTTGANENKRLTVILSAVGAEVGADVLRVSSTVAIAAAGVIAAGAATVACPVTGVTCVLAGVAAGAAGKVGSLAAGQIPAGKEIFFVGEPSTEYWLDAWGTIFHPVTGQGGRI